MTAVSRNARETRARGAHDLLPAVCRRARRVRRNAMDQQFSRRQFESMLARGIAGCSFLKGAELIGRSRAAVADGARRGITGTVHGSAILTPPSSTPPGAVWRYGLAFPFQAAPRKAGLFCNIRGVHGNDFEEG